MYKLAVEKCSYELRDSLSVRSGRKDAI